MRGGRRGAVLIVVLLLILALGAVSAAALSLSRSELVAESAARRYLTLRAQGERVLLDSVSPPMEGWIRLTFALGRGYRLIEAKPALGPSMFSVVWVLDPDSVARELPGALRAGGTIPETGVAWLDDCPSSGTRILSEPLDEGSVSGSSPLEVGPRVGPLGVRELLALQALDLPEFGRLPETDGPEILRASAPTRVWDGRAEGLLVAAADLRLEGSASFSGLLVVADGLSLGGSARIEGVALVGGSVRVEDEARILGCPERTLSPLRLPALSGEHPLPSGSFLGRF